MLQPYQHALRLIVTLKHKTIASGIATYAILGAALFGFAGTFDWAWGWSYFAVFVVACVAVTRWLYVHSPVLLDERMNLAGNAGWDKLFVGLISLGFIAWWIAMP